MVEHRDNHLPDRDADLDDRSQHERPGRFRHPVVCPLIREDLLLDDPRIHPVSRADVERLRAVGKCLPKSIQSFYVLWRGNSQQLVAIRHVAAEYAAKALPNQYTSTRRPSGDPNLLDLVAVLAHAAPAHVLACDHPKVAMATNVTMVAVHAKPHSAAL